MKKTDVKRIAKLSLAVALLISLAFSSFGCNISVDNDSEVSDMPDKTKESSINPPVSETDRTETAPPAYVRDGDTTDFITSLTDIDAMLERPYDGNVPTAFSEGVFTLHSSGWGFDGNSVFVTGNSSGAGMEVRVEINGQSIKHSSAIWRPSHVSMSYSSPSVNQGASTETVNIAKNAAVSATFTSQYDPEGLVHIADEIISYTAVPRNRWSNYVSPVRTGNEMITFDFGCESTVESVTVYPYDDGGATVLPSKISVEYYFGGEWKSVENEKCGAIKANAGIDISFDIVRAEKLRLVITPKPGKAVGITEVSILGSNGKSKPIPAGITVEEKKFVTEDDVVISLITVINDSSENTVVSVEASPSCGSAEVKFGGGYLTFGGTEKTTVTLAPGERATFKNALAFSDERGEGEEELREVLADENILDEHVEDFLNWFADNVPYFDCDDGEILQTYYFRWLTYRNHIRKISGSWDGYIISEFLPNVSWSGLYNSISCAAGHHIYEGRWIRDEKYLDSYQEFWFISGADPRLYSFAAADAYYNRYLVSGDSEELVKHLDELENNFIRWDTAKYFAPIGLYQQLADRDGMESGVGGDGARPTINSYMYGDAVAIAKISRIVGDDIRAEKYENKAEEIKVKVMDQLWNEEDSFFETAVRKNKTVRVRELIGYVPWYYNLPDDSETYAKAFKQLLDEEGFLAPYGPTTVEQRNEKFLSQVFGVGCRWDGPSWPYATSQTLTAAANLLNNYEENSVYGSGDWFDLLKTYAKSQYKDGYSWIGEDLHPLTGEWIVDLPRSVHYNHSTFTDLVITGLVGIRPEDNDESLRINPLFDEGDLGYFALENVGYRGHNITVIYDESGEHYGIGKGMRVFVDGYLMAESDTLVEISVSLIPPRENEVH